MDSGGVDQGPISRNRGLASTRGNQEGLAAYFQFVQGERNGPDSVGDLGPFEKDMTRSGPGRIVEGVPGVGDHLFDLAVGGQHAQRSVVFLGVHHVDPAAAAGQRAHLVEIDFTFLLGVVHGHFAGLGRRLQHAGVAGGVVDGAVWIPSPR